MAKRFSRINFILISIIVAIGLFLSFFSFNIPYFANNYAGFMNAINLGYDIGEGQTGVFELKPISEEVDTLTSQQLNHSVIFVRDALSKFGAAYQQVGLEGDNMIRVEIDKTNNSEDLLKALSNRVELVIRGTDSAEVTEYDVSANRIISTSASYQAVDNSYSFGVVINFDDLGSRQFRELTDYVANNGQTIYFYSVDGEKVGSLSNITRGVITGSTFLPQSSITNENQANIYALNVLMGALDVKLNILENSVSSAFLGYNSAIYIGIALAVVFVIAMIFMIIKYRDLGLICMLTSLINLIIFMFLLQALPFVTLSATGIIGCILGFALTIFCHVFVFEKIKREYSKGKKIPLAFKMGFKDSLWPIVDISAITMIASLVLFFVGFDLIKSFATPLFIGGLLSLVSTLVFTRCFTKWYLPLNSTKPSHLALKKEMANDEE